MTYYAVDTTVDNFHSANTDLNNNQWNTSDVRKYLNGDYLTGLTMLSEYVQTATLMTRDNSSGSYNETDDQVFILSHADLADAPYSNYALEQERAFDGLVSADIRNALGGSFVTRTEYIDYGDEEDRNFNALASFYSGGFGMQYTFYEAPFYPCMWVKYAPEIEVSVTVPDVEFNENNYATIKDGTQVTFQATATSDGKPMKNPEFVYELYNDNYESPILQEGKITSEGVWDTTGDGMLSPGGFYYVKVYVKGYPDVYAQLNFTVLS